jgi:ribosomal protein L6P/L9E
MLKENAKRAPAELNANLNQQVAGLYGMKNDLQKELNNAKSADRSNWDTTKSTIDNKMNQRQQQLNAAESMIR